MVSVELYWKVTTALWLDHPDWLFTGPLPRHICSKLWMCEWMMLYVCLKNSPKFKTPSRHSREQHEQQRTMFGSMFWYTSGDMDITFTLLSSSFFCAQVWSSTPVKWYLVHKLGSNFLWVPFGFWQAAYSVFYQSLFAEGQEVFLCGSFTANNTFCITWSHVIYHDSPVTGMKWGRERFCKPLTHSNLSYHVYITVFFRPDFHVRK